MTELTPTPTNGNGTGALILVTPRPADQNPALVYLASLAEGPSRRTMRQALDAIAALVSGGAADCLTLNWAALRFQHTAAIRAALAEQHKPATCNKMLSALRGVLGAAFDLGQMDANDFQRAIRIKSVKGETLPAGRELTAGEVAAIMAACAADPTPAGARDAALFAVEYGAGLRRAEVVALDLADYDRASGELRIFGKGKKERIVWVTNGAFDALADWLALRGDDPGPLFVPVFKGGRLVLGDRLTPQAVYNLLAKRAGEAGVKAFSPHDLRRTFVSNLLDAGADIATVQRLAGHSNVETTARYDRRGERAKKAAAELLHVPYHKRARQAKIGEVIP
jgi:site-specific recombinase XerD